MSKTWTLAHKISLFAMLITTSAIIANTAFESVTHYRLATEQAKQQIRILAELTAFNIAAPSMFGDAEAANTVLNALSVDQTVISARLLSENKQLLAEYRRASDTSQKNLKHLSVVVQWQNKPVGELFLDIDMSPLNEQLYRQIGFSLVSTLVAVLIAGLLVQWMSHTLTNPLRRLSNVAEKIGSQGDYSLRAVVMSNRDDVSQLSLRFNTMLEHIEMQDSDLRKQQKVLHTSEQRLLLATASAGLGVWEMKLREDILEWDDRMFELFGITRTASTNNLETWTNSLHPNDKEQAIADYQAALQGVKEFDTVFRIVCPDGTLKYIKTNAVILRDADGAAERMLGVNADVTTQKQMMTKLEEKNAELEHYAYMVSHDLKSPLVTIKTFLGYLQQDMAKSDHARIEKDMDFMNKAADKMSQLLDELLEMSRIGRVVAEPEQITFRAVVEEALNINAGVITQHDVAVTVEDRDITLFGDHPRLVQIWQNLIDNAVKFLGDQPTGQIRIGVVKIKQDMEFYVCDNGIGVDARYHDKIFGLFEKLDAKVLGSGLGLALVKRIVQLYDGKIRIESKGTGHGTCFRFTLPTAVNISKGASS